MILRHLHPKHKGELAGATVPLSRYLWAIRIFIILVLASFMVMGYLIYQVTVLSHDNQSTIKANKEQQAQSHQDRLSEDASLQKQISDAVCTFVDPIPPRTNPQVDKLRDKYGCPYTPASVAP